MTFFLIKPSSSCAFFFVLIFVMGKDGIERFNVIGFHTWQAKVKGLLMKKGLWGVVKDQGEEDIINTRG